MKISVLFILLATTAPTIGFANDASVARLKTNGYSDNQLLQAYSKCRSAAAGDPFDVIIAAADFYSGDLAGFAADIVQGIATSTNQNGCQVFLTDAQINKYYNPATPGTPGRVPNGGPVR